LTDCDSTGSSGFGGPLAAAGGVVGPGDVDFFHFHGEDKIGCIVDPTVSTPDLGFRLCEYVACDISATQFKSCKKGTHVKSPNGLDGCCTTAPGEVSLDYTCKDTVSLTDTATIYIGVDQATACTPYTVDYHF
jgi:hypothetical protein